MEWKSLSLKDKALVDHALKSNPLPLSDYTFTNLWIWNPNRQYELATIDNFLCIRFTRDSQRVYLYPIGQGSRSNLIEKLCAQGDFYMRAVPENALPDLETLRLSVTPETDHFDYIYSYQDLLHLHGDHFQPKRNFIHQFERNYLFEYQQITPALVPKIKELEVNWYNEHPSPSIGLQTEHAGILTALNDFEALKIYGGALIVENQAIAYSISEHLSNEMLVVHLEKCLKEVKGGYAMINQQMLMHQKEVAYVNREEDLGLDNLTKVKQSYHPIRLEKKYILQTPPQNL